MITIRKARIDDAQLILDIRERSILAGCINYYDSSVLQGWASCEVTSDFVSDVSENYYVAELNSVVVGTGKITVTIGAVDAIFVEPKSKGLGIAKSMLSFLETQLQTAGCKYAKLDATLNAASFYRKHGYIGDALSTYHSPRGFSLDCIQMSKTL